MIGEIHFSFATFLFLGYSKIRVFHTMDPDPQLKNWRIRADPDPDTDPDPKHWLYHAY